MLKVLSILFLLSFQGLVFGASEREFSVPIFEQAPVVDGSLDDICWKTALKIKPNDERCVDKWVTYIGCSKEALYVGIDSDISNPEKLLSYYKDRDSQVWKDHSFEVLVDYRADQSGYVQLITNLSGARFDCYYDAMLKRFPKGENFDGNWESVSKLNGNKIFVEFRIPYSIFDLSGKANNDFGINILRMNHTQSEFASVGVPYHDPKHFILLKDLPIPDMLKVFQVGNCSFDLFMGTSSTVKCNIQNLADTPVRFSVDVQMDGFSQKAGKSIYEIKPAGMEKFEVKFLADIDKTEGEVTTGFVEEKTGRVLRTINRIFHMPNPLTAYTDKYMYMKENDLSVFYLDVKLPDAVLEKAHISAYIEGKGGKSLFFEKRPPLDKKMVFVKDISYLPFSEIPVVISVQWDKKKVELTVPLRRTKGPF
jgi:hypothetical protein